MNEDTCPRCGLEELPKDDIVDGRCSECRLAEAECEAMAEHDDDGGSPWGN